MWIYLFHSRGCPTGANRRQASVSPARTGGAGHRRSATKEHLLEGFDPKWLKRELRLCEGIGVG
jgi:hypothetical protein